MRDRAISKSPFPLRIITALALAILFAGCASGRHSDGGHFTYTPPPPVSSPTPLPGEVVRTIRAITSTGRIGSARVRLLPSIAIEPPYSFRPERVVWSVQLGDVDATSFPFPELLRAGPLLLVDLRSAIDAVDWESGAIAWRRENVRAPFAVSARGAFARTRDGVALIVAKTGKPIWRRRVCGAALGVRGVAVDGTRAFVICTSTEVEALDTANGRLLFRRTLAPNERGAALSVIEPGYLEARDAAFDPARQHAFVLRSADGSIVADLQDDWIIGTSGEKAFVGDSPWNNQVVYDPIRLRVLNLRTGMFAGIGSDLAPDPQRFTNNGIAQVSSANTFILGNVLFAQIGSVLYRYNLSAMRNPVRLFDDVEGAVPETETSALVTLETLDGRSLVAILDTEDGPRLAPVLLSGEGQTPAEAERPFVDRSDRTFAVLRVPCAGDALMLPNGGLAALCTTETGGAELVGEMPR